jgi:heme-degrading monooxygenase HmoA
MYARVLSFQSVPEKRKAIEAMANDLYAFTKSLNGFVHVTYMVSDDEREYSSVSLWESREAAVAAGEAIREKSAAVLGGLASAPPKVVINEVYDPTP